MNKIYIINKINNDFHMFDNVEKASIYLLARDVHNNIMIISNDDGDCLVPLQMSQSNISKIEDIINAFIDKDEKTENYETELKIGHVWIAEDKDPFKTKIYAKINNIKDGYVEYDAYYKSNINNNQITYRHSCTEDSFKILYPKKLF